MILSANGNPHRGGHTAGMAAGLFTGPDYGTLNLIDYHIGPLCSAQADGNRFEQVRARIITMDVIVLGTPVYWRSLGALPRTLFERMYGAPLAGLAGWELTFFTQGDQPRTEPGVGATAYTITHFTVLYGLDLTGTTLGAEDLPALRKTIGAATWDITSEGMGLDTHSIRAVPTAPPPAGTSWRTHWPELVTDRRAGASRRTRLPPKSPNG